MTYSGEEHGESEAVGGFDDFRVALRTSGLNNGRGSGFGDFFDTVGERKEGIGCGYGSVQRQLRLHGPEPGGIDARHLSGADPDSLSVARIDYRI